MRVWFPLLLLAGLAFAPAGCRSKPFDGPTVDAFTGRVTREGKPVKIGEGVSLKLFHETGQSFGIPLGPDGSFKIGWMPIGKYSVMMKREPQMGKGAPMVYNVPGGLAIEEAKTEYTIELGKGSNP